jgi:WD40 repeat protein
MKLLVILSLVLLISGFYVIPVESQCGDVASSIEIPLRDPNQQAIYSLAELETITAENAHRLRQISLLSIGNTDSAQGGYEPWLYNQRSRGLTWLDDGVTMVLPTTQGVFLYDTDQPHLSPYLLPNSVPSVWAVTDPTGEFLLTMDADGTQMMLWNIAERSLLATSQLQPGELGIFPVSPEPQFTPDGNFIVAMNSGSQPGTFAWQRYTPDTLELVDTLLEISLPVTSYTLGSAYIGVVTEEETGYLLSLADGTIAAEFANAHQLRFSQDHQRLFVATTASVQIWNTAPSMVDEILLGDEVHSITEANNVLAILYHPDEIEENYLNRLALYDLATSSEQPRATMITGGSLGEFNRQAERMALGRGEWFDVFTTMQSGGNFESITDVPGWFDPHLQYSQPVSDGFSLREPLRLVFSNGCGWSPAEPADAQTGDILDGVWPGEFDWDDLPANLPVENITSIMGISPNVSVVAVLAEQESIRQFLVEIYDVNTGELLVTLEHPAWRHIWWAQFRGEDGKLLFVSTGDEAITVWGVPRE